MTAARAVVAAHRPLLSPRQSYPLALVGIVVALGLTYLLEDYLGRTILILFWPLVLTIAVFGGIGPAVFTSVLAVFSVDYFILPPRYSVRLDDPADILSSLLFVFASFVISTLAKKRHFAEYAAIAAAQANAEMAQQLEEQAIELESQLEEAQAISAELEQTSAELEEERETAEKSAAFARAIIEAISDPFIVQDVDWRFQFINAAAGKAFFRSGHATDASAVSLIGREVWDAYPDLSGTVFEREMKRAASERVPVNFEAFYPLTGRWTQLNCYPLADGGLAIQWKDVTSRRKAQEAREYLDRATQLLTSPLDAAQRLRDLAALVVPDFADWCAIETLGEQGELQQVAVAHVDPEKVKWSEELNQKYPARSDSPMGAQHVIRTGTPQLVAEITDETLVAGAVDDGHLRIMRELGLRSAMIVPLSVLGRTFGAVTLVSAESRRRYTEDDLRLAGELARRAAYSIDNAKQHQASLEAQRQAESANRAKSQFLAAMSHELRTPLNAIAGYVDLIMLGVRGPISEELKSDLERVRVAQRHLLGLIGDVLDFSRLEAGRVTVHTTRVAIAPVLTDVVSLLDQQARARGLALHYDSPEAGTTVSGDVDRIRQILLNLLTNAVKYTDAGEIRVRCATAGERVHIEVSDTGVGIDISDTERVFHPFVQVHRSLSTPTGGVGLGLAISRELAHAMNGTLTVESTLGVGSTFTLDLPSAPNGPSS